MDAIRRWQIVTAVTAAAGLGIGALAVGQQPAQDVASIELIPSPASTSPRLVDEAPASEDTEIVTPEVQSLEASAPSLDSPQEVPAPPDAHSGRAPRSAPAPVPGADSPEEPDSPDEPDSPASVDSGDSLDSD